MHGNPRVFTIGASLLDEKEFLPFGDLIEVPGRSPDFNGVNSSGWKLPVTLAGPPEVMLLRSEYRGWRFSKLERHFAVAQTFIPLGHVPAVVAVAGSTSGRSAVPAPEDVRAFVIDGSVGYILRQGTWHSVDRYPMYAAPSHVVMITSRQTQVELGTQPRSRWRLTEEVDYLQEHNVLFEIV